MKKRFNRRDFLKKSSAAGLGVALGGKVLEGSKSTKHPPLQSDPIDHLTASPSRPSHSQRRASARRHATLS